MSGLGLNKDKAKIISAIPFTDDDRLAITNCAWDVKTEDCLVDSHTYLGILMGADITTIDIYATALDKFTNRVALFSDYLRDCNINRRIIIFNVFLLPLFSYLIKFFIIPFEEVYLPVRTLIRKHVIPYAGGGYSYTHLLDKKKNFGFSITLTDLWAWSTAMLISHVDLSKHHGKRWCIIDDMEHVHYASWGTLIIPEHIAHMTMHFLHNYGKHDDSGLIDASFYSDDPRIRRRQIYNLLVQKEYLDNHHTLSRPSDTGSLVYKVHKHNPNNAQGHANRLLNHARYLTNFLPSHIWNFFVNLIYNTLPFDMRIRKALNLIPRSQDPDNPFPCKLLCGTGPDSAKHVYGSCPVFLEIKDRTQNNSPRTHEEEFHHSLLDFDEEDRRKTVTLVIALWATWCISRKGLFNTSAEATNLIMTRSKATSDMYTSLLNERLARRAAAASRGKAKAQESFQFVETKLASMTCIIFTDSNGSGKAKHAGAGAFIDCPYLMGERVMRAHVEMKAPLGPGTNNLG